MKKSRYWVRERAGHFHEVVDRKTGIVVRGPHESREVMQWNADKMNRAADRVDINRKD